MIRDNSVTAAKALKQATRFGAKGSITIWLVSVLIVQAMTALWIIIHYGAILFCGGWDAICR